MRIPRVVSQINTDNQENGALKRKGGRQLLPTCLTLDPQSMVEKARRQIDHLCTTALTVLPRTMQVNLFRFPPLPQSRVRTAKVHSSVS